MMDKEKRKEYRRKYYLKNRDKILAKQKSPEQRQKVAAWFREYRKNNPEKIAAAERKRNLKHKYGITPERYEELLQEQGHRCKICGVHDSETPWPHKLVIDHCHNTKVVRGLLCSSCNRGIGLLNDCPEILSNAIKYLTTRQKIK